MTKRPGEDSSGGAALAETDGQAPPLAEALTMDPSFLATTYGYVGRVGSVISDIA